MPQQHFISNVNLTVNAPRSTDGFALQQDVSKVFWNALLPVLSDVFDRFVAADEVLKIDRLDIQLPPMDLKDWQTALPPSVYEAIREALEQLLKYPSAYSGVVGSRIEKQTMLQNLFEAWLFFIKTGQKPLTFSDEMAWQQAALDAVAMNAQTVEILRGVLRSDNSARERLVFQHDTLFLTHLAEAMSGRKQTEVAVLGQSLIAVWSHRFFKEMIKNTTQARVLPVSEREIHIQFWLMVFEQLAEGVQTMDLLMLATHFGHRIFSFFGQKERATFLADIIVMPHVSVQKVKDAQTPPSVFLPVESDSSTFAASVLEMEKQVYAVVLNPEIKPSFVQFIKETAVNSDSATILIAFFKKEITQLADVIAQEIIRIAKVSDPSVWTEKRRQKDRDADILDKTRADNALESIVLDKMETDNALESIVLDKMETDNELEVSVLNKTKTENELGITVLDEIRADNELETTVLDEMRTNNELEFNVLDKVKTDNELEATVLDEIRINNALEFNVLDEIRADNELEATVLDEMRTDKELKTTVLDKTTAIKESDPSVSDEELVIKETKSLILDEKRVDRDSENDVLRAEQVPPLPLLIDHKKEGNREGDEPSLSDKTDEKPFDNVAETDRKHRGEEDNDEGIIPDRNVSEGTRLMALNAGLVLLHPFLKPFFDSVGLLKDGKFANIKARRRAAALLHYLGTGKTEAAEYDMVVAKVLVGLPLSKPIDRYFDITDTEREEADGLLRAVLSHWKALGSTSPDGLREGFLQRNGLLTRRDDGWLLKMETHTIDILLDRLPWGLSIIRLGWMKEFLYVEWY